MSSEAGFRPTTTVSILQTDPDDLVDEFGDPMDNEAVAASGIPMSIIIQSSRQFLPSENRMTIVHQITARVRANVPVNETSRIKDERTGEIYMIEQLVHPQDPFGSAAIRLVLRRVK
jgi:hypothetical protein